ncbi:unnamed protein product [Owenia fusiformis]|uniref:Uncharacterized protein n=1 Tax=Owenia fusiformis TaxID=6347 RepID=A0A8J1TS10_OWEFU|nr:unnamed protein product [Owenia fusiformis]
MTMEIQVVVLRPKPGSLHHHHEFRPRLYDILLIDTPLPTDKTKTLKQLPTLKVPSNQEPSSAILSHVYQITGGSNGGVKGQRVLYVPPPTMNSRGSVTITESTVLQSQYGLYFMPVDSKYKLNSIIGNTSPTPAGFYALDFVLDSCNTSNYAQVSKLMLQRLESWLKDKLSSPHCFNVMFATSAQDRLKRTVNNPAFEPVEMPYGAHHPKYGKDAFIKMRAVEKCDIVIQNQAFRDRMRSRPQNERRVPPAIPSTSHDVTQMPKSHNSFRSNSSWKEEFPLHYCSYMGDTKGVRDILASGISASQKDRDTWAPIHYAAWQGHLDVIKVLLVEGHCSPNITNSNLSTPLHFASINGRPYVVELLLNHQDIDINARDVENKTALMACENVERSEHKACSKLLRQSEREHRSRPAPKIEIRLLDNTVRQLHLVSGHNTTVLQLHEQMLQVLEIPDSCKHMFALWLCSKNLHLQLKMEHKPMEHIKDWREKVVRVFSDFNPAEEEPVLYWRRDATLSIVEERKVKNKTALHLLYYEAYHNYIESLYPCADQDAIILGAILMQIRFGDFDSKKAKEIDKILPDLIPVGKRKSRSVNYSARITSQYKDFSAYMMRKKRTTEVLQHKFLTLCWNLTVYGSAYFHGHVKMKERKSLVPVHIAVNDLGIHVIHTEKKYMLNSFSYKDMEWSGKTEDHTLVLQLKQQPKGGMLLRTKQSGLISHLMSKLSQLNPSSNP